MAIDLDTTEGRKKYLSEKLDDLLDGINDSYGALLMEELLSRLELTVKDFNGEMKRLCEELVSKEKERQQLFEMFKATENTTIQETQIKTDSNTEKNENDNPVLINNEDVLDDDAPEWEKKLAKLEKK